MLASLIRVLDHAGFQGLMYCIWLVLASGLVMPANKKSELACMAYFFVMLYQGKALLKYKKMTRTIEFAKDQDHDFYHRCYSQLNFHTTMVVFPLVAMLVITLIFTFSFMEVLNYNNQRPPSDIPNWNASAYAFPVLKGCMTQTAINYNPLATERLDELCTFARCYEDVYMVETLTGGMQVPSPRPGPPALLPRRPHAGSSPVAPQRSSTA